MFGINNAASNIGCVTGSAFFAMRARLDFLAKSGRYYRIFFMKGQILTIFYTNPLRRQPSRGTGAVYLLASHARI